MKTALAITALILVAGCAGQWQGPPGVSYAEAAAAADSLGLKDMTAAHEGAVEAIPTPLDVAGWVVYYGLDVVPGGHKLIEWRWVVPEVGSTPATYVVMEQREIGASGAPTGSGAQERMYAVVRDGEATSYGVKVAGRDALGRLGVFSEPGYLADSDTIEVWWPDGMAD